jgi:hypothetical protein
MNARRIALATTPDALPVDEDWPPLSDELRGRGFAVDAPDWEDPAVDWSGYALVLPRSTWNYMDRPDAFAAWTRRVAAESRLENDPATIAWNTDKRYLLDLERAGVPVIPTTLAAPGEPWTPPDAEEYVVKPAVGAGSRGARRFRAGERAEAARHARALQDAGATALTQPYLASVDTNGETALMWFAGRFSHAIRKGAILRREGDAAVTPQAVAGLFAAEQITPRAAAADELDVGARAVAVVAARRGSPPLYARVDLIRDAAGQPRVLELEMTEPSLFLAYADGASARLADAIEARLAGR